MKHPSDTFQIALSQDGEIILVRKDPENLEMVLQSTTLQKHEGFILMEALLDDREYQERALRILMDKNIARPDHSPQSPIL